MVKGDTLKQLATKRDYWAATPHKAPLASVDHRWRERMRFVYFSVLFATAYWFLVSLVRLILAKRNVNVIVESPERSANVNALERAWTAENPKVEEED
ncbi:hypothetical protein N9N71_00790 [Synechococcus sp. AH-229-G18]|nr:hypothetical protein [Synechococcus sp. AH-229-G18]